MRLGAVLILQATVYKLRVPESICVSIIIKFYGLEVGGMLRSAAAVRRENKRLSSASAGIAPTIPCGMENSSLPSRSPSFPVPNSGRPYQIEPKLLPFR
ncbi:hypothetical protein KSP40_PGU017814 [Platanthera guangdongensis]|uniref:Secreted protein n=1 Tax=Platanthera guangdongensis TaxID=2320717 RepID=A0ABR2M7C8_9ASPA